MRGRVSYVSKRYSKYNNNYLKFYDPKQESKFCVFNRVSPFPTWFNRVSDILIQKHLAETTIMFIIFWDLLMVEQIFISPQVKLVYTFCLTSCPTTYDLDLLPSA